MKTTRRDFLTAGIGAMALANAPPLSSAVRPDAESSPNAGRIWVTDDDQRLSPGPPLPWTRLQSTVSENVIIIDREKTFQPILGFGAALTDGSCYLLNELAPSIREKLFHLLFHCSEMGLNVCRTCIGSSDHSASLYSFDDGGPDADLKRFSIEHDRAYILPILRQARSVNPDLFLFSSPWSPPGWMKDNGSMLGGCMRHTYMPSYANYFIKFLDAYANHGVPIQAVTVQNEVDADQQGLMPACFWPQDCEATFIAEHLGPAFERNGVKTKIWIIDHNYNLWGRAIAEFETPGVRKYADAVAWHGYSGKPEWMMRVQNAFPDVEMHWTEGSSDHDDPEYLRCWAAWAQKFSDILQNGCRSITGWCLVTDERGGPNVGPYPLGGMLTIDSQTKDVYHSGQFWAMAHYARFIKRGAFRIESQSPTKDLFHSAFENPDGSLVLVITNSAAGKTCDLRLETKCSKLWLPANSVTTLVYSGEA